MAKQKKLKTTTKCSAKGLRARRYQELKAESKKETVSKLFMLASSSYTVSAARSIIDIERRRNLESKSLQKNKNG